MHNLDELTLLDFDVYQLIGGKFKMSYKIIKKVTISTGKYIFILFIMLILFILIMNVLNLLRKKWRNKVVNKLKGKFFNPNFFEPSLDKEVDDQSLKNIYLIIERAKVKDDFYHKLLKDIDKFLKYEKIQITVNYCSFFIMLIPIGYLYYLGNLNIITNIFLTGFGYLIIQYFLPDFLKAFKIFIPRRATFSYINELIKTSNDVKDKLYNFTKTDAKDKLHNIKN